MPVAHIDNYAEELVSSVIAIKCDVRLKLGFLFNRVIVSSRL